MAIYHVLTYKVVCYLILSYILIYLYTLRLILSSIIPGYVVQICCSSNSKLKKYEIILTSPFEYFKNTSYENKAQEKEFLDNSNTYILSGCWSSRIYQKTKNALLQNKLSRIIEPLNFYTGANYQKNIDFGKRIWYNNSVR